MTPDGRRPKGIYFGLHDWRARAGKDNPATAAGPLIPGEPWKGRLRIPEGTPVGRYTVYARCVLAGAEGTEGSSFYMYENSTYEVIES